jgi:diguanylate cyclase (GGDEF)-like protein
MRRSRRRWVEHDRDPVSLGIAVLVVVLLGATGMLVASSVSAVDELNRLHRDDLELSEAAADITLLDEILTHMAVHNAYDPDPQWVARYDAAVADLDQALATSRRLATPDTLAFIDAVDDANDRLVRLETRSFERAANGDLQGAQTALAGDYDRYKADYRAGIDAFADAQRARLASAIKGQERRTARSMTLTVIAAFVTLIALVVLARTHERQRRITTSQSAELERVARSDPLTGLASRHAVVSWLDAELGDRERPVAAAFVDLDGFKAVNDAFGHRAGDEVLVEFARRLRSIAPDDALVGRMGGDEFLVALPRGRSMRELEQFGQRLVEEVRDPIQLRDAVVQIGSSVGVTEGAAISASTLLSNADAALYHAKRSGRGQVVIYAGVVADDDRRARALASELAFAAGRHEFDIDLQPVFDATTLDVVGAEALVRWNHPTRGRLRPDAFLGVAEASSVIVDLDRAVVNLACDKLVEWQRAGRPIHLAVNVSSRTLLYGQLADALMQAAMRSGADLRGLRLELTESRLIDDIQAANEILQPVRALGVGIALDDFGVGYASIGYVRSLQLDTLKIDRTAFSSVESPRDADLVGNIAQLARIIGLEVVAEGIESEHHLEIARQAGCDFVQGYHLGVPMTSAEFDVWLERVALHQP